MTKAQSQAQIDGSSTWTISGPLTDHHVKKKKATRRCKGGKIPFGLIVMDPRWNLQDF